MKKMMAIILVGALITSIISAGCGVVVTGSGDLETKQYNFSGFDRVDVGYAFEVEINKSDSYSISITADDNLFEYIDVSKEGDTLKVGMNRIINLGSTTLKAKVTMPQLRGVDFSGATRGDVSDFNSKESFDVEVSGASSLKLNDISTGDVTFKISGASHVTGNVEANNVDLGVSGASTAQLKGSAIDIIVDASGASRVELNAFSIVNADIELSGASSGNVKLDGRLDVDLSGASRLEYDGEPTMGTIDISSGSSLIRE